MKSRLQKLMLAAMVVASVTACASRAPIYDGITFLSAPADVSSAWKSVDGDVFIVLEKGVVVDRVMGSSENDLPWTTAGAYLLLTADTLQAQKDGRVWLLIEGKKRQLVTHTDQQP
jgi:hypothetical protein